MKERRNTVACDNCRKRRQACIVTGDTAHSIGGVVSNRNGNLDAAVRAQCRYAMGMLMYMSGSSARRRLERIVESLERRDARHRALGSAADCDEVEVELDDLVASLTNLAVLGEKGNRPNMNTTNDLEMLKAARKALADVVAPQVSENGFVLSRASKMLALDELIAKLPPWPETRTLLLEIWPQKWTFYRHAFFAPTFPTRVRRLYDMSVSPDPGDVAEIYSVLCLIYATLAVEHSQSSDAYRSLQGISSDFAAYAYRALDLAEFLEHPSTVTLRAAHTLAMTFIGTAKETANFEKAFALFPLTGSLISRLGLQSETAEMLAQEIPIETWERRALANSVQREDLFFSWVWGQKAYVDIKSFSCPAPDVLEDDEVPPDLRSSPFRYSAVTMQSLKLRNDLMPLRQEMIEKLSSSKRIKYEVIKQLIRQVDAHEARMPRNWGAATRFCGVLPTLPFDERVARFMTLPGIFKLRITLHRLFVAYRRPVAGMRQEDIEWHRTEIFRVADQMLSLLAEGREVAGPYLTLSYTCHDVMLAMMMIQSIDPDDPRADNIKQRAVEFRAYAASPNAPVALHRLSRLISFFDHCPSPRSDDTTNKRRKAGRTETGRSSISPPSKTILGSSPALASPFDFSPSSSSYGTSLESDLEVLELLQHSVSPLLTYEPQFDGIRDTLDLLEAMNPAESGSYV